MRFAMLKAKTGELQRRDPERISGVDFGVRDVHAMAAAHKSCQHQEILNCMRETSVATLTGAPILGTI